MSSRLHYTRPHDLARLHDELLAAGITPERVEGSPDGTECWITVADDVDPAAVESVVLAHDPDAPSARDWAALRAERNRRLALTDWTQLADAPANIDKAAWAAYRQALRDLPERTADPRAPVWPEPPHLIQGL